MEKVKFSFFSSNYLFFLGTEFLINFSQIQSPHSKTQRSVPHSGGSIESLEELSKHPNKVVNYQVK